VEWNGGDPDQQSPWSANSTRRQPVKSEPCRGGLIKNRTRFGPRYLKAIEDMDIKRVDLLLKYILAAAGQEDPGNREVGPIHLVKYVYLADLA